MTTLDKAIIAYYERDGKRFEVYVDPEPTYAFLERRKTDVKNILVADEIYSDAKKGERAKSADLQKAFGTTDPLEILEIILKDGEVQLTTEQRKKKQAERYKQIVAILLRESIDPRTKAPHTQIRIEQALKDARVHVDPFKDPRDQLEEIIKKLRPILPLKFEKIQLAVKVPAAFAHRSYGVLKNYGIKKEQWAGDGSLIVVVEIFAGMQGEFLDRLNKLTAGQVETKQLER
ncbi:TPA: ribosome assembly factor SBDS [Candidatus Micrarchaeota archaeon]|nr:ribosome assembly factor SBDS [Candidatus Micrarchaeota archaeon]